MIVTDEQHKSQSNAFDPHAGIVSPPPSYAELVNTQPTGSQFAIHNAHNAHLVQHAASLPLPSIPHHHDVPHHHNGRFMTMPEPSRYVPPQPTSDMATHLNNVRYHEMNKEAQRQSAFDPARRPPFSQNDTDVSFVPTQDTGTSTSTVKNFDVLVTSSPIMPLAPIKTQPTFQQSMEVRNVRRIPTNANGDRQWSHGCCSSMWKGCGMCCCATWCPCVAYSQIKSRMSHLERNNYPHPHGGDSCTSDCLVHGILTSLCGIGWVMQIGLRSSVRDRYRIGGSACGDLCCSWCCTPCSLAQESLEVELEEQALMGSSKWIKH